MRFPSSRQAPQKKNFGVNLVSGYRSCPEARGAWEILVVVFRTFSKPLLTMEVGSGWVLAFREIRCWDDVGCGSTLTGD